MGKVEDSPHYDIIIEKLLDGESDRMISDWLKSQGEQIAYGTIFNYRKNVFNKKSTEIDLFEEARDEGIIEPAYVTKSEDLELCNIVMDAAKKLRLEVNEDQKTTILDIYKLALQAATLKQKILNENKPKTLQQTVILNVPEDPKLRSKARDVIQQIMAGKG
jgi:hypothetical protein